MYGRWIILFAIPATIMCMPVPDGLTREAWNVFAVYAAAIIGLILRPAGEAVVMLTVIAFGSFLVPIGKLLSGYGDGTVWLVFTAFLITQAFADTGLGRRVAYVMIDKIGSSSLGVVYGQMATDLILSPATPSNTARSGGIVYPIFRNVASALNSEPDKNPRKIGAFITICGYSASLSTSAVFLTACAPNALTVSFAKDILKVNITWMDWFIGLWVPALFVCVVVPFLIYKIYPPELRELPDHKKIAADGLAELGPMKIQEKLLVVFFVLAIIGWATSSITKINGTAVALLFFACCAIFKLISWKNVLSNNGAWNTLMWYGSIIGISAVLSKAKFFTWLADVLGANMNLTGINEFAVFFILLIVSVLVRYVFASMGAYVGAFIPVLFTLGLVAEVPPVPLALLMGASSAFGCLLTHYGGAVGPIMFGTGYVPQKTWWKIGAVVVAFNVVVYMTIGMAYWKFIGLM